jgi:Ca2+-transporting ATPase
MSKNVFYVASSPTVSQLCEEKLLIKCAFRQAVDATMQIEDGEHKNSTHEGNTTLQPGQTSRGFTLDLADAFTPDPGAEDMFKVKDNKFAFSPGHLSKLLNPKSHNAFYALGGLAGLERGLSTDRSAGLSVDETNIENSMTYEGVAARGAPKYGAAGGNLPEPKTTINIAPGTYDSKSKNFWDRRRIFSENRLPNKKNKTIWQLAWQTYNDKVLILLTIAAVVSLALGLYQTFGGTHEEGDVGVEWIEGVAILAAIAIVVIVGTLNDCKRHYPVCVHNSLLTGY